MRSSSRTACRRGFRRRSSRRTSRRPSSTCRRQAPTAASRTSTSARPVPRSAARSAARRKPAAGANRARMRGRRTCAGRPTRSTTPTRCRWHRASSSISDLAHARPDAIVTLRERLRAVADAIRGRKPPPVIVYRDPPPEIRAAHPGGHFYSPIVDPADAIANAERIWPEPPADVAGIEFDDASHRHVLETLFPRFYPDFDYPENGVPDEELAAYYVHNSQFGWLDARAA